MASSSVDLPVPFSPDEKRHPRVQFDRRQMLDRGNRIRKDVERIHPVAAERDRLQERRDRSAGGSCYAPSQRATSLAQ